MIKSLMSFLKYIWKIIYILTHVKIIKFKKPSKIDILIADRRSGQEAVFLFFNQFNYGYLDTRLEEINLYVLYRAIQKNGLRGVNKSYMKCFISYSSPKIVFCMYEYNWILHELLKKSNCISIMAQFAVIYGEQWSIFYRNHFFKNKILNLKCDYLLALSSHNENFLNKLIYAKYLPVGSIKINTYLKDKPEQGKDGICFISEFRNKRAPFLIDSENLAPGNGGTLHAYKIISEICKKNGIRLSIALSSSRKDKVINPRKEIKFYKKINSEFNYSDESSYTYAIKSNIIVCMLSNLGLELISLGYKVFFLDTHLFFDSDCRKNYFSHNFGIKGDFWDRGLEYKSVKEKILKLYNIDNTQWEMIYTKYKSPVEYFDPDNRTLSKIINNQLDSN